VKKSVGFVAMLKQPNEGGHTSLMAVLSRRGYLNEKGEQNDYPGCYQITCRGEMKEVDGGDFKRAMIRVAHEELGRTIADWLRYDSLPAVMDRREVHDELIVTFGALVPRAVLSHIYLPSNTGGHLRVMAEDFGRRVIPTTPEMRQSGPPSEGVLAMFPDEITAVQNTFVYFSF
jgi:hypothetical protein